MRKAERLAIFGRELRRRREEMGFDGKVFALKISISPQHLSQIETAYDKGGRGPVGPSDDVVEAISRVLNWRIIDIRQMLGQVPDDEIKYIVNPDTARIAEAYDNAPQRIQKAVDALLADDEEYSEEYARPNRSGRKSAAELAFEMDREKSIGKRAE